MRYYLITFAALAWGQGATAQVTSFQDMTQPGNSSSTISVPAPHSARDMAQRDQNGDMSPAMEQGDTQRPPPPGLAGDWFGLKTKLADLGLGLTGRYASESAWNYTGGKKADVTETGQLDIGVMMDLKRLIGLNGGTFQATVTYRQGHDLGQRAGLQTLQLVQEVYGRGQTWRVTQFWYEQAIAGDRIKLKVGATAPGEDFAAFSCHFENLSFCGSQPGNLVGDYWYNWPVSQWGARLRVNFGNLYVQTAVYEENPRNLNKTFTVGHIHGATGALIPIEIGLARQDGASGPVGSYKVGGWISTADAPDLLYGPGHKPSLITGLAPIEHSARYGGWVNFQQQLTGISSNGKSGSGLSVFVNFTAADRQTSAQDNQIAVGMFYKGLLPHLTEDVLGIGLARTDVNGRLAKVEQLQNEPTQHAEYAAELYYSLHPFLWLEMRPDLQWIHHPGGYKGLHDVGVFGMKAALTL